MKLVTCPWNWLHAEFWVNFCGIQVYHNYYTSFCADLWSGWFYLKNCWELSGSPKLMDLPLLFWICFVCFFWLKTSRPCFDAVWWEERIFCSCIGFYRGWWWRKAELILARVKKNPNKLANKKGTNHSQSSARNGKLQAKCHLEDDKFYPFFLTVENLIGWCSDWDWKSEKWRGHLMR